MKYIVKEVQNRNSEREGSEIEAKDLSAAKRTASRMQVFEGTVLRIEAENGAVLSTKESGTWRDENAANFI